MMIFGRWCFGSLTELTTFGAAAILAKMPDSVLSMNMCCAQLAPSTWGSTRSEQSVAKDIENRNSGNATTRAGYRVVMTIIFLAPITGAAADDWADHALPAESADSMSVSAPAIITVRDLARL